MADPDALDRAADVAIREFGAIDTWVKLYEHGHGGRVHGPYPGRVLQSSTYTSAMLSDVTRALPFIAAGLAVAAGMRRWQRHDRAA